MYHEPEVTGTVPTEAEEQALFELAGKIRTWQEGQRPAISDNALVRRFPGLGSTKTFKKLREQDSEQLGVAEWLPKYRGVWAQIEAERATVVDTIHDNISATEMVNLAGVQLFTTTGLARLVIVEGDSGAGKSESLRFLARKYTGSVLVVEADESWQSPHAMLCAMGVALGVAKDVDSMPSTVAAALVKVRKELSTSRRLVAIDEGHHMNARGLNIIKSLINTTSSMFIIAALDTLWKKLTATAWQEVKQLLFNRMLCRVRLLGPTVDDAYIYFGHRLKLEAEGKDKALMHTAITNVVTMAAKLGSFAYLRQVVRRCIELGGEAVDAGTLVEAAKHVKTEVEGR